MRPVMSELTPCRYLPRKCGFSFNPPGWRSDEFMNALTENYVWRFTVAGAGIWEQGEQRLHLVPGTAFAARQSVRGSLMAGPQGWAVIWIVVQGPAGLAYLNQIVDRFGQVSQLPPRSEPVRRAEELVKWTRDGRERSPFFWSERAYLWLSSWHRHLEETRAGTHDRFAAAAAGPRHLAERSKTLKNLASRMGYSPAHLARRLKSLWKEAPGGVLRRLRLEDAARHLRESAVPVHVIAGQVGYTSVPAFVTAFRRHFGQTPGSYRRRQK
jgi:AraC-like DNA-binding protein